MASLSDTEVQSHVSTYDSFLKIVLAAASHVTILLTSLALAFIADAPVFAVILFLVGHAILLAVLFTRRRTHSQGDKALRLVPVRS